MKPLPAVQAVAVADADKGIPHERGKALGGAKGGLPHGGDHGLLGLAVPLDGDAQEARRKGGLEEAEQEADGPYAGDIFGEPEGKNELSLY